MIYERTNVWGQYRSILNTRSRERIQHTCPLVVRVLCSRYSNHQDALEGKADICCTDEPKNAEESKFLTRQSHTMTQCDERGAESPPKTMPQTSASSSSLDTLPPLRCRRTARLKNWGLKKPSASPSVSTTPFCDSKKRRPPTRMAATRST